MSKVLFYIIILFTLNVYCQSNVYKPFPSIYGDWWVRTSNFPNNSPGPITDELYFTTGDTIINTFTYKKTNYIYKGNATGPVPALNYIFTGGTYNFAYRNDSLNKKIYIIPKDSLQEKIWYDFNLNLGDTLKQNFSTDGVYANNQLNSPLIVLNIDSTLMCNNYYKRYSFSSFNSSSHTGACVYLVERVGFIENFIHTASSDYCSFEPTQIPNTNNWSLDACPNDLASIKNNTLGLSLVNVYPNPTSSILNIDFKTIKGKSEITIVNVLGRNFFSEISTIDLISINIANLPNGIYFVNVNGESNNSTQKILVQH